MASDGRKPPEMLRTSGEFCRRWESGDRTLAVIRTRDAALLRAPGRIAPRVRAGNPEARRGFVLLANYDR
jgi:hypothetical protein